MVELDLVNEWLTYKQHNQGRASTTVNKYRGYLSGLSTFLTQERGVSLLEASTDDLEEFTGMHAFKAGLSPKSRRAIVAAIRGFYTWLSKKRLRADNPAAGVPYPVSGNKLPTPLETKYARALFEQLKPELDTFQGVRDCAIIMTLIGCGFRVSGLLNLNESDLTFVDVEGEEWLIIKITEKGKKERLVPAPHDVKYIIHAYLGHEDLTHIDRTLPDGDRVLFVSTMDRKTPLHEYRGEARRLSRCSVDNMIKKRGRHAGIPDGQLHAHAMRHLYGTQLAEYGIDILTRQALMGHEKPETTEIYTKLATRQLTRAVAKANPFQDIETPITQLVKKLERKKP